MPQERLPRKSKSPADGVEAVDRALSILAAFQSTDKTLSLAVLAQRTGLYKSTLLRLGRSLEKAGYLIRHEDSVFSIGTEPLRLAALVRRSAGYEQKIRPVLADLADETGQSASFFVRKGDSRLCLYRENAATGLRDAIQEGDLLPLDQGAAGKILGQDNKSAQVIPVFRPVITLGERDPEIGAVALPVYAADGLVGSLTLSGPLTRFTKTQTNRLAKTLTRSARQLSLELGAMIRQT